ncbi:hypothetical protein RRG08_013597 [Elysia crispata]|uniref:Uncharacterized protein n=1 Tax=Elysia crispata TaxID=231223 RepID=A0AAE1CRV0_9GAST|nr:hypothetical protein RRG08_013597 [Elysia crispata]
MNKLLIPFTVGCACLKIIERNEQLAVYFNHGTNQARNFSHRSSSLDAALSFSVGMLDQIGRQHALVMFSRSELLITYHSARSVNSSLGNEAGVGNQKEALDVRNTRVYTLATFVVTRTTDDLRQLGSYSRGHQWG